MHHKGRNHANLSSTQCNVNEDGFLQQDVAEQFTTAEIVATTPTLDP